MTDTRPFLRWGDTEGRMGYLGSQCREWEGVFPASSACRVKGSGTMWGALSFESWGWAGSGASISSHQVLPCCVSIRSLRVVVLVGMLAPRRVPTIITLESKLHQPSPRPTPYTYQLPRLQAVRKSRPRAEVLCGCSGQQPRRGLSCQPASATRPK